MTTAVRLVALPTDADLPRHLRAPHYRRAAADALALAARLAGAELGALCSDARGAPLPSGDWHRSVSHTPGLACAALARAPLGIDVERLDRPRAASLVSETLCADERRWLGSADAAALLALWTAKEAVLKRAGCGLAELGDCRLAAPPERGRFSIRHRGAVRSVRSLVRDGYAFALDADLRDFELELVCAEAGAPA